MIWIIVTEKLFVDIKGIIRIRISGGQTLESVSQLIIDILFLSQSLSGHPFPLNYHRIINRNNTTVFTSGTGTATLPEHMSSLSVFSVWGWCQSLSQLVFNMSTIICLYVRFHLSIVLSVYCLRLLITSNVIFFKHFLEWKIYRLY